MKVQETEEFRETEALLRKFSLKDKITTLLTDEPHLHIDLIRMLLIQALQNKDEETLERILNIISSTNYKEFKS